MTAIESIKNCDDALNLLRGFWMDANTDLERDKWMEKINAALDKRVQLMRERDAMAA